MAHITFIHGIANKPPAHKLLQIWRRALADGANPFPLEDLSVSSSMVYWADVLYKTPDIQESAHEGLLENSVEAIDAAGDAQIPTATTIEEKILLEGLRDHLTSWSNEDIESAGDVAEPDAEEFGLERIPLPWSIKKRFMEAWLRDVHHYLFNVEFSPRPGDVYRVRDEIRRRVVTSLSSRDATSPHILVSHSMGTVIAYDCLKRVKDCPPVDGFVTIGGPLGIDEVQDRLQPEWTRRDGFPHERNRGSWTNVYDRLDPVCGFDARIANDFRQEGSRVITDVRVSNSGRWRHSIGKYLRQNAVRDSLRCLLGR
jgi:hypothetical protein